MQVEKVEELIEIMRCEGRTPDCIGRNCIDCRAELLFKYFDITLKSKYVECLNNIIK